MSTDRPHATLGGSSANIWSNCTGSVVLYREIPPQETSSAMLEGTIAHEVAEKVVDSFLHYKLTGEELDVKLKKVKDEHKFHAEQFKKTIWEEVLNESITGKIYGVEDRFSISDNLHMFGYIDFWCVYNDDHGKLAGCIVDYKYGYTQVPADNNPQLAFYSVAMRKELLKHGKKLDYVRAGIFQPRVPDDEGNCYKETKFSSSQLDKWEKKFKKAAEDIYIKKKFTFKTGDQCTFCRAKGICKKYVEEKEKALSLKLVTSSPVLPEPEMLSEEQLARVVLNKKSIEEFLNNCAKYCYDKLLSGGTIEGLKVVQGSKGRRSWVEDNDLIKKTFRLYGIEPTKESIRGITELTAELRSNGIKDSTNVIDSLTTRGNPSLSIVSSDDPRPAHKTVLDKIHYVEDEDE